MTGKMGSEGVLSAIEALFRDALDREDLVLRLDMRAEEVPGWDSLAHIRLIAAIEERFDLSFTVDEVGAPGTVGALVRLVEIKLS